MAEQVPPKHPDLAHLWERLHGDADPIHENRWIYGAFVMLTAEVEMLRDSIEKFEGSRSDEQQLDEQIEQLSDDVAINNLMTSIPRYEPPKVFQSPNMTNMAVSETGAGLYINTPAEELKPKLEETRCEAEKAAQSHRDLEEQRLIEQGKSPEVAKGIAARIRAWPLEVICGFCPEVLPPDGFFEHVVNVHPDKLKALEALLSPKTLGYPMNDTLASNAFSPEAGKAAVTLIEGHNLAYPPVPGYPIAPENAAKMEDPDFVWNPQGSATQERQRELLGVPTWPRSFNLTPPNISAPFKETVAQVAPNTSKVVRDALFQAAEADGWFDLEWLSSPTASSPTTYGYGYVHLIGRQRARKAADFVLDSAHGKAADFVLDSAHGGSGRSHYNTHNERPSSVSTEIDHGPNPATPKSSLAGASLAGASLAAGSENIKPRDRVEIINEIQALQERRNMFNLRKTAVMLHGTEIEKLSVENASLHMLERLKLLEHELQLVDEQAAYDATT